MGRPVRVLAVPHQLQGPKFCAYVEDPFYETLIEEVISGVDFVFEEAAGRGPSIAENHANTHLGLGHYLDVDPPPDKRSECGLAKDTGSDCFIVEPIPGSYRCQIVCEHRKREELWLQRIRNQHFDRGLMVCGIAHGLSFAFRLELAGFSEVQLYEYIPFNKLCAHTAVSKP